MSNIVSRTHRVQGTGRQVVEHFFIFTKVRVDRLGMEHLGWNVGADIDGGARFFRSERHRRAEGQEGHRDGDCKLLEHCRVPVFSKDWSVESFDDPCQQPE
ncbi:hypothetical protein D3C81_2044250 [compost metagenome]